MLIKSRNNTPIVSAMPFRPTLGPRARSPQRLVNALTTFNGVYMRPNIANAGVVPASGSLSGCPDIWVANQSAVPNPQTTLASATSYATSSNNNITGAMANYVYVRGFNNTAVAQTKNVSLYYAPSGVIQWPGQWQNNVILTDQNLPTANITALAPQTVGVADQVFVWNNPAPPPPGSDHYCLIAQINDAANSNPFPDITSALDLAGLITNNLGWGWKNTTYVAAPGGAAFAYSTPLTIPLNIVAPGNTFMVWVNPTNYIGWSVQFSCSQTDSSGKVISLGKDPVQVTANGQIIGLIVTLEPGFNALVSVTMYSNGNSQQAGATMPLMCSYQATGAVAHEAYARGLVDPAFTRAIRDGMRGGRHDADVTPTAYVGLGGYTWANPVLR